MALVEFADHKSAKHRQAWRDRAEPRDPDRRPGREAAPRIPAELTVQQYLRHLDDTLRDESKSGVMSLLVSVSREEMHGLIRASARAKGRYFASLLDVAGAKSLPSARQCEELRRLREVSEELEEGVRQLRDAVEAEVVQIRGVRR